MATNRPATLPISKSPRSLPSPLFPLSKGNIGDLPLGNERWSGYSQQRLLAFLTNKVYTHSGIPLNKTLWKGRIIVFHHDGGKWHLIKITDRGGYCETQECSPQLAWKFPSLVQSFLWQRLMPKAFWVLLSLYNNSSPSCIWPIVQWGTTGRDSIPAPAANDFMATSMRIDSFHKFDSS